MGRFRQQPGDEPGPDVDIAGGGKLFVDPVGISVADTKETKTSGIGHRSSKTAARRHAHRRQDDRMGKSHPLGESGCDGHRDLT